MLILDLNLKSPLMMISRSLPAFVSLRGNLLDNFIHICMYICTHIYINIHTQSDSIYSSIIIYAYVEIYIEIYWTIYTIYWTVYIIHWNIYAIISWNQIAYMILQLTLFTYQHVLEIFICLGKHLHLILLATAEHMLWISHCFPATSVLMDIYTFF